MANVENTATVQTIADFVSQELNRRLTPAFYDGDCIITPHMKFRPLDVYGRYELRQIQDLSIVGFERNLSNWCDASTAYQFPTGYGFQFNRAADAYRATWAVKVLTEQQERQNKARAEQELFQQAQARQQAMIADVDALLAAAKFKKQVIAIAWNDGPSPEVQSYVYQGLAIHKQQIPNMKFAKYTLTHIASGLSLGLTFSTLRAAKIACVRFAAITDWTTTDTKHLMVVANPLAKALRQTIMGNYGSEPANVYVEVR